MTRLLTGTYNKIRSILGVACRDVEDRKASDGFHRASFQNQAHRHAGGSVEPFPERSDIGSVPDRWHPVIE